MPRIAIALISSCILLACGDAPLEPASFAEHCGVAGPVRLLALEPGQSLGNTRQIGDRLYHTIGTLAPDENSSPYAPFTDRSTWSTGLCGEAPVHLADDLVSVFTVDRWPGVLLACQEGAGIVSLDPTGTRPPHLLFPSPQCSITWADALAFTDHGVIGLEDPAAPTSALHLYPFPDDPRSDTPEPELLLDNVDTRVLVQPWPDAVHAVTSDGDLIRVDLADRSHHVEQTDVRDFQISADRRYLAWRDPGPLNESSLLHLRDNLTGTTTALGDSLNPPAPLFLRYADQGLLAFDNSRVHFLPDLSSVAVPNGFFLDFQVGPLADDRWLLFGITFLAKVPGLAILDLKDGSSTALYNRPARLLGRHDDGLLVLDGPGCCTQGTFRSEGAVWHVPLAGGDAHKVADRATTFRHQPAPNRLVTAVDLAGDRRGTLIVIDLDTRAEQRIDDHVLFGAATLASPDDPDLLIYTVHDGERSGVWTTRLPPAP